MKNNKVIVITGPTASGKSQIAYDFALSNNAEIVSADSMQVYRYLDIGTAKPSRSQLSIVKHHLIDHVMPTEEYNVVRFKSDALAAIDDILKRNMTPVVVGGTGLYINSLIYDLEFSQKQIDPKISDELNHILSDKGVSALYEMLIDLAPDSAKRIHPNNIKRVIRALKIAKSDETHNYTDTFKAKKDLPYDFLIIGLEVPRETIYMKINNRVDKMFSQGLAEETRTLLKNNLLTSITATQAIGYKEVLLYLRNEISYEETIELVKKNTRNYAKRQMTWFKKIDGLIWLKPENVLNYLS